MYKDLIVNKTCIVNISIYIFDLNFYDPYYMFLLLYIKNENLNLNNN
jgi:hypothetical protein